jgi:hypothetical protein
MVLGVAHPYSRIWTETDPKPIKTRLPVDSTRLNELWVWISLRSAKLSLLILKKRPIPSNNFSHLTCVKDSPQVIGYRAVKIGGKIDCPQQIQTKEE